MAEFYMKVAGVTFNGRQEIIKKLKIGDKLRFLPEPTNPHDYHAVKVITEDGECIGYVPRERNERIFQNIVYDNILFKISVSAITGGSDANYGVNIRVEY